MACKTCGEYRRNSVDPGGWCGFRSLNVKANNTCKLQKFVKALDEVATMADEGKETCSGSGMLYALERIGDKAAVVLAENK